MIICVNPMWSIPEKVNSDSNYVFLKAAITEMLELHPDWIFVWLWPTSKHFRYYKDGFFEAHPNVVRLPYDGPTGRMQQVIHFDVPFWRNKIGYNPPYKGVCWPADLIWNNIVEIGHLLRFGPMQSYDDRALPVILNQHHYVMHPSLGASDHTEHIKLMQIMGGMLADINVFNSQHCRSMFLDVARDTLSGAYMEAHFPRSEVLYFGLLDRKRFEALREPSNDQLTFVYNHRLEGYKNWETTFAMFERLWEKHGNFKVVVTAPDAKNMNRVNSLPFVEFQTNLVNHDDYLRMLSRCHVNVLNSQHETLCISAIESLAMGHALVAPNAVTFPELVPKGYPYLFDNEEQQWRILDEMAAEWRPGVNYDSSQYVFHKFNSADYAYQLSELFLELAEQRTNAISTSKRLETIRKRVQYAPESMSIGDAHEILKECTGYGPQVLTSIRAKRIMNFLGYADTIEKGQLRLKLSRTAAPQLQPTAILPESILLPT